MKKKELEKIEKLMENHLVFLKKTRKQHEKFLNDGSSEFGFLVLYRQLINELRDFIKSNLDLLGELSQSRKNG